MTFRIPQSSQAKPATPLDLFYTLKERSADVQHPWGHQVDLFRSYLPVAEKKDVALELPTGAGKSLVGLVLAEFRRQAHGERVAYLCPTRQLARQVHRQASEYGVSAVVLVGKQREYEPDDYAAFTTAQKIAITTYSAIFNVNPRIDNAETLVLDDAHAAESYVINPWALEVEREHDSATYNALIDLFVDVLPEGLIYTLTTDDTSAGDSVGIVLQPELWARADRVRSILAKGAAAGARFRYAWSLLSERLEGCQLYVSRAAFVLRPLSPPSESHAPFANARHRIYMSATLGSAGDLERAIGVAPIERLPMPAGWEKHGTGRRLILFPDACLRDAEIDSLAARVAQSPGRVLIVTTDKWRLRKIQESWLAQVKKPVLLAADVENDMTAFTSKPDAVLLLTNRYDGIDLPGDACRTMILDDHPDATNLQEKFFSQRLGASAFLRERIRTRVTQAMGRCTRSAVDFATIFVVGERLWKFLGEGEVRAAMHPELQVELAFGIENSRSQSEAGFLTLMDDFRTPAWEPAERHLTTERQKTERREDTVAAKLRGVVSRELEYVYAAWNGEWQRAFEKARLVVDQLEGGRELRPYQALWLYLASSAAGRAGLDENVAKDLLERAVACAGGLSFFVRRVAPAANEDAIVDAVRSVAAMNIALELGKCGGVGSKFQRHVDSLLADLASADAKSFERGLGTLGRLLGFTVFDRSATDEKKAIPDAIWSLEHAIVIGWEAKSGDTGSGPIPIDDVRQARLHVDWIKDQLKLKDASAITIVFASPRISLDPEAVKFAGDLRYMTPADVCTLASEAVNAAARVRSETHGADDESVREAITREFGRTKLLPDQLVARFKKLVELHGPAISATKH